MSRQADVLFQPETSPAARMIAAGEIEQALATLNLRPSGLWLNDGSPSIGRLATLADRLHAGYLFISRASDVSLAESTFITADLDRPRPGVERRADVEVEGLLFDARENRIVWRDRMTGGTIARTEYVRHLPRIRTDEQCIVDAATTAYAHLRASFEDYRRKFDRDQANIGPKH